MGAKVASASATATATDSASQSAPVVAPGVAYQLLHKHMPRAQGRWDTGGQRAESTDWIGSSRVDSGRSQQVQLITLFSWINEGGGRRQDEGGVGIEMGKRKAERGSGQRGGVGRMFDRLNF